MPAADRAVTQHDNVANTADLTDEESQALVANNSSEYQRLRDIQTKASSAVQLHVKKAKAEGVTLDDMKDYVAGQTEEGQRKLKIIAERTSRIARWLNFPLGAQASLFEAAPSGDDFENGPPTNKSFRSGKEAGMIGAKPEVPNGFDPNEWMRGFHEGQAKLGSAYKTLETPPPDADLH